MPGNWKGDLIAGSNTSFIATLVERHSRYVMRVKDTFQKMASMSVFVGLLELVAP